MERPKRQTRNFPGPMWGPWVGVPLERQALCAVEGCASEGKPRYCIYDDRYHHHGCIHYDCDAAKATEHGLTFRDGWGWLCGGHYQVLVEAAKRKYPHLKWELE